MRAGPGRGRRPGRLPAGTQGPAPVPGRVERPDLAAGDRPARRGRRGAWRRPAPAPAAAAGHPIRPRGPHGGPGRRGARRAGAVPARPRPPHRLRPHPVDGVRLRGRGRDLRVPGGHDPVPGGPGPRAAGGRDAAGAAAARLSGGRVPVPLPTLPVSACLDDLRAALAGPGAAVLQAPPGAGKTTIVPLALADEPWLAAAGGRIVMLEPRRLATRAAARRMAALRRERVGELVGYRTRDDREVGPGTRIEVVTEALPTRHCQRDPGRGGVGIVTFTGFPGDT